MGGGCCSCSACSSPLSCLWPCLHGQQGWLGPSWAALALIPVRPTRVSVLDSPTHWHLFFGHFFHLHQSRLPPQPAPLAVSQYLPPQPAPLASLSTHPP